MVAVVLVAALNSVARADVTSKTDSIPLEGLDYIFDLAVDRADSRHLLLATGSGIFRSAPDGMANRVSRSRNGFWNLAAHPTESEVLLARGIPDDGQIPAIVVSRDSGRTWHRVAGSPAGSVLLRKIDISKALPETIYGVNSDLWVSRNGSESWVRIGSLPDRVIDIAASSLDADTVYAATLSGVMVSLDGGRSWREFSAGAYLGPVTVIESGWDGAVYVFSLSVGLLKTDERIGGWTVVNDNFGGCIIQHLAIDPVDKDRLYAVLQCNAIVASSDGGRTWGVFGSAEKALPACPVNPFGHLERDPLESELDREKVVYAVRYAVSTMR